MYFMKVKICYQRTLEIYIDAFQKDYLKDILLGVKSFRS